MRAHPVVAVLGGGGSHWPGALSMLVSVWADLGALLIVFLVPIAVTIHGFRKDDRPGTLRS